MSAAPPAGSSAIASLSEGSFGGALSAGGKKVRRSSSEGGIPFIADDVRQDVPQRWSAEVPRDRPP